MTGQELLMGLSYIGPKYIEESEQTGNRNPAPPSRRPAKKLWLIAAVIALTLLLVGCAVVYAHWASGLEDQFRPSNAIRQQAQQSGLSVLYPQDPAAEEGLSASDQGITVSVKQTFVDKWNACIVLKIEGFALPEGVQPCFYGDPPPLTAMPNFGILPVINSMTASS